MTHELRCSKCNKQISVLTSTQLGDSWFCPHDAREAYKELQVRCDEWKKLYEEEKAKLDKKIDDAIQIQEEWLKSDRRVNSKPPEGI